MIGPRSSVHQVTVTKTVTPARALLGLLLGLLLALSTTLGAPTLVRAEQPANPVPIDDSALGTADEGGHDRSEEGEEDPEGQEDDPDDSADDDPDPALAAARQRLGDRFGDRWTLRVVPQSRLLILGDLPAPIHRYLVDRLARLVTGLETRIFNPPNNHSDLESDSNPDADSDADSRNSSQPSRPWLSIVVPDEETFATLTPHESIAGWYESHTRTIICRQISYTLQHELVHALHAQAARAAGLRSLPLWLYEGFASAFEDSRLLDDGTVRPHVNARLNRLKDAIDRDTLPPLEEFLDYNQQQFFQAVQAHYGFASNLIRWLDTQGLADDLWRAYIESADDDPSGRQALQAITERTIEEIDAEFRSWVTDQERSQPLNVQPRGLPYLGVRGEDTWLGLEVRTARRPARTAGIERRDLLLAVEGLAISHQASLNQALRLFEEGDRIQITLYRPHRDDDTPGTLETIEVELGR